MMDIDEIYDELEDLGINYSAHEVSQAVRRRYPILHCRTSS